MSVHRSIFPILLAASLAACGGPAPPPEIEPSAPASARAVSAQTEYGPVRVDTVVVGLEHPWSLAFLPGGDMLVSERPGRLRRIRRDGQVSAPLDGLPSIFTGGQAGLMDIALSPNFASDRLVYLSFAEPNLRGNLAGTAVMRGRLGDVALEDAEVIYRQQPKRSAGTHVGSRLVFDDDGRLFVTQGDNRVAASMAQELDVLPGKLVRINADGSVPADNPFVGRRDVRPEIWSYGHRNMQGAALHPRTRQLWTSEHGPMGGDELNVPEAGGNYGWPVVTHGRDYNGAAVRGSIGETAPGMLAPHHVWAISPALSGMAFYDAALFPRWRGNLFLGALAGRELIRLELDGERVVHEERMLGELDGRVRDVRVGADGALYLLIDDAKGRLLRVTPAAD